MNQKGNKVSCMVCSCPCEMHKEHDHPAEDEDKNEARSCQVCGHERKADGTGDYDYK